MKKLKIAPPQASDRVIGSILGLAGLGLLGWAGFLFSNGQLVADLTAIYKTPVLAWSSILVGFGLLTVSWLMVVTGFHDRRKYQDLLKTGDSYKGVVSGTRWESQHVVLLAKVDFVDGTKPLEVASQPLSSDVDPTAYYPVGCRVTVRGTRNNKSLFVFELDRLPDTEDENSLFVEVDQEFRREAEPKWETAATHNANISGREVVLRFSHAMQTDASTWEIRVHSQPRLRMVAFDEHLRIRDPFDSKRTGDEEELICADWEDVELDGARLEFNAWNELEDPPRIESVDVVWLEDDVTTDLVNLLCREQLNKSQFDVDEQPVSERDTIAHWNDELTDNREGPWRDCFLRAWLHRPRDHESIRRRLWSIWRVFLAFSLISIALLAAITWFACGFVWSYWLQYSGAVESANQTAQALRGVPIFWFSMLIALGIGTCSGLAGGFSKFLQSFLGFNIRMTRLRHALRTGFLAVVVGLLVPWSSMYGPVQERIISNLKPPPPTKLEIPGSEKFMVKWHEGHKWTAELSELKPGTLRATATWSGESLDLKINNSGANNAVARKAGKSPLTIDVTLSEAELDRGGTWTVCVSQFKNRSNVKGTVSIEMLPEGGRSISSDNSRPTSNDLASPSQPNKDKATDLIRLDSSNDDLDIKVICAASSGRRTLAFDGDNSTRWVSKEGDNSGAWLETRWEKPVKINNVVVREAYNRIVDFVIERFDDAKGDWVPMMNVFGSRRMSSFSTKGEKLGWGYYADAVLVDGTRIKDSKNIEIGQDIGEVHPVFTITLPREITTKGIRLRVKKANTKFNDHVSIYEMEIHGTVDVEE